MKKEEHFNSGTIKEKGITLISLVITIIVLLILTGIIVTGTIGTNGIIKMVKEVKAAAEIKEEKEVIKMTAIAVLSRNTNENITYENLDKHIQNYVGIGKVKVVRDDDELYVKYIESQRCYKVEKNGEFEGPVKVDIAIDANPGDITTDSKGNALAGTEEEPYEINCIEDLCGFSNSVNSGISYSGKYIILTRDLDFNSDFSYVDGTVSVSGDIVSCKSVEELMDLLTNKNKKGFIPIGNEGKGSFSGKFNGKDHQIKNIHQNTDKCAGLFGYVIGSSEASPTEIRNLTIRGNISASNNAGGLIGYRHSNYLILDKICNYVNVSTTYGNVGGLIGENKDSYVITNCFNYGKITSFSTGGMKMSAGGLIGFKIYGSYHIMTNCANYGEVTGNDTYAYDGTGGIIGGGWGATATIINNTYNYAKVSGIQRVGGIIGSHTRISAINQLY